MLRPAPHSITVFPRKMPLSKASQSTGWVFLFSITTSLWLPIVASCRPSFPTFASHISRERLEEELGKCLVLIEKEPGLDYSRMSGQEAFEDTEKRRRRSF